MSETSEGSAPIAHGPGEGEAFWFFGGLTTIKSTGGQTAGRVAVTENLAPRGSGSPLHVHHREDEWFYVIEGELTFWVGGEVIPAPAGSFVYGPRDIPHTFVVSSEQASSGTCTPGVGCGQLVAHNIRSGAAFASALASLPTSS